jgi:hypothetical protein
MYDLIKRMYRRALGAKDKNEDFERNTQKKSTVRSYYHSGLPDDIFSNLKKSQFGSIL